MAETIRGDGATRSAAEGNKLSSINDELLRGVQVSLEARLGTATLTVEQMMALKAGAVVDLETGLGDLIELYLNDALVARCEIVAVGDKFGVRIVEIAPAP
ncbi:MAG TPA: FliM/FliN family flagellar motor switch protein [Rhizomicrobium sp.]|jgi:flagellar motor switch protein FliN/FliY|nr:FliM/FliN family flagellar motor switch protein [Rhizomicrobium sp.]